MESAAVRVVLNKLYDLLAEYPLSETYSNSRKASKNLQKLGSILSAVHGSLSAAEQRSITAKDPVLLDWLAKLKDAAFDADDVLDAVATESLRRKAAAVSLPQKALDVFKRIPFHLRFVSDVAKVLERFEDIEDERKYHLNLSGASPSRVEVEESRQTHAYINTSTVVRREEDREKVVGLLLEGGRLPELGVVSIVGMGGLGKTTLAKMVFADKEIESRFQPMIWVSVYNDLGLMGVARKILEGLGRAPGYLVLETVREALENRRFFMVLDDVWDERRGNWEDVRDLLRCGARGSRVLVTTRSKKVPVVMDSRVFPLRSMSEEESWCIFRSRAFGWGVEEREELVAIGKEIAKKSKGLPLVASILGGTMIGKTRESQWVEVRDNEIWDCLRDEEEDEEEILPALRLSYYHLPLHSKPCFAYCAIFRKGVSLDREKVIQHWVANGLIMQRGDREMEDVGGEIFDDLLARCLLEDMKRDKYWEDPIVKMHEMIHDLARFAARNECHIFTDTQSDNLKKSIQTIRFLSVDMDPSLEALKVLRRAPKLRTLLTTSILFTSRISNKVLIRKTEEHFLSEVLENFKLLRVLDLHFNSIDKAPEAIGNLKHLRYLNLSGTCIRILPGSICSLLNLRTLRLGGCLIPMLPNGLKNLSSLCHLDIRGCNLSHMPTSIGQLTRLRTLTDFFVSKENGCSSLKELQSLNLCGEFSIWKLENVKDVTDASNANLIGKEDLGSLRLCWTSGGGMNSAMQPNASQILDVLQPHHNLSDLRLSNYDGTRLPEWMADSSSKLVKIALWNSKNVDRLQAFGQLKCITYLQFIGLHKLKNIGEEFYGHDDTLDSFPVLKEIAFNDMPNLASWSGVEGRAVFPLLQTLTLMNCPRLRLMPKIPTLKHIELWDCNDMLLESVANMPSLSRILLKVRATTTLPKGSFMNLPSLKKLSLVDCVELVYLPSEVIQQLPSLEHFIVNGCRDLVCLPHGMYKLSSLQKLEITYCISLAILPQRLHWMASLKCLKLVGCLKIHWCEVGIQSVCTLQEFHVEVCNELTDLSTWLQYAENLLELRIQGEHLIKRTSSQLVSDRFLSVCCCGDVESLPKELAMAVSLEELSVHGCGSLICLSESFKNLKLLRYLYIYNCPNLMALCTGLQQLPDLLVLLIKGCPELEKRCKDELAKYWHLISHIPERKIGEKFNAGGPKNSVTCKQGSVYCPCC